MKRTYDEMCSELANLGEQSSKIGEKIQALKVEIKATPEHKQEKEERRARHLASSLPDALEEVLTTEKARELFPEHGKLLKMKIWWEEDGQELRHRIMSDVFHADLTFEKKTVDCTYQDENDYTSPDLVSAKGNTRRESWNMAIAKAKQDPAVALWSLIYSAYVKFINEGGDSTYVDDNLLREVKWGGDDSEEEEDSDSA
jgi:hypothetical protein